MSDNSVKVNIFFLLDGNTLEEQIQNARNKEFRTKTISSVHVEQPTIELDVRDQEFFSTSEIKQYGGTPEKQPYIRDFQVALWEPVNNNSWNVFVHPIGDE